MQQSLVEPGQVSGLLDQLFGPRDRPQGPLEEFLLIDLDQLVDHQRVLSFVCYRYNMALAECNKNIRDLDAHIDELEVMALRFWREENVQPGTNKPYSFEESKEMRKQDPSLRMNLYYRSCWLARRDELNAYLKSLAVKVSLTPGCQGMFNRLFSDKYDGS